MRNIDRGKIVILLSVVTVAALLGGWYITVYAADAGVETMMPRLCGWPRGQGFGGVRLRSIEVSDEYETNVITIAENDPDVQKLLTEDGYSISGVRPIIKTSVDADGAVTTAATSAIVVLESEDATGHAAVMVDLNAGTVTEIVILTRTVIEKT